MLLVGQQVYTSGNATRTIPDTQNDQTAARGSRDDGNVGVAINCHCQCHSTVVTVMVVLLLAWSSFWCCGRGTKPETPQAGCKRPRLPTSNPTAYPARLPTATALLFYGCSDQPLEALLPFFFFFFFYPGGGFSSDTGGPTVQQPVFGGESGTGSAVYLKGSDGNGYLVKPGMLQQTDGDAARSRSQFDRPNSINSFLGLTMSPLLSTVLF